MAGGGTDEAKAPYLDKERISAKAKSIVEQILKMKSR